MAYSFFVVQKYYNNGAVKLEKITAGEAAKLHYQNSLHKTYPDHEWHVTGFGSEDAADEFIRVVLSR